MNTALVAMFDSSSNYWIGYERTTLPCGSFAWQDGSTASYTNWHTGQPDCFKKKEACGVINWSEAGFWNDWPCSNIYHGICGVTNQGTLC